MDTTFLVPPLAYTFAATIGGMTSTSQASVDCYLDPPFATAPLPLAMVQSPVALSWTRPAPTGIQYNVAVFGPMSWTASVVDQSTTTVSLTPGSYTWGVSAAPVGLYDGTSALRCGSEWNAGPFTVQ